jgi:hypothetical protein
MHGLFSGHRVSIESLTRLWDSSQKGGPRGNLCPIIWKFFGLH